MNTTQDLPAAASAPEPIDPTELRCVEEVVLTLGKAIRAHQLYDGMNPVYDRFVDVLRLAFLALWQEAPVLEVDIEERRILYQGTEVYLSEPRTDNLAFLFYRDGIRRLVFRPGFEQEEMPSFLRLLARVHRLRTEQEDLVTLLWEQDFALFEYRYLDISPEGGEMPTRSGTTPPTVSPAMVRAEVQQRASELAHPGAFEHAGAAVADLPMFQETLHFLEEAELRVLRDELRRELDRELMRDTLAALFDRFEDAAPDRQQRILKILTSLLPELISSGRVRDATLLLRELATLSAGTLPLQKPVLQGVRDLFEQLAEPNAARELVRTMEDSPEGFDAVAFAELLGYFPPRALAPLIEASERAERPEIRRRLREVVERLAATDPSQVTHLLGSAEPLVVVGAARLLGQLSHAAAAPELVRLLERSEASIRLAAVAALQDLRVGTAAGALLDVLDDPEREVRIAAVRALGALGYPPSRGRLEEIILSRRLREADVTERIAFFEAFGSVAGTEGVALLSRLLNKRSWLGRRESPEIRACAALALGRIDDPSARTALEEAARDPEPVVRTAVSRGLRREYR